MAKVKSGLGKGLGALISEGVQSVGEDTPVTVLPLQKVEPNPLQPSISSSEITSTVSAHGRTCRRWRTPFRSTALSSRFPSERSATITRSSRANAVGGQPDWQA